MLQSGNRSALPLLQSIYTLSKACQNDMVGAQGFLEEAEQQQVQTLIESAKKIMNQLSNKAVEALPKTPAATHPALNNSRFHGHTNLYPDRFRLFLTPRSSPAEPPIFPRRLVPSFPLPHRKMGLCFLVTLKQRRQ